MTSTSFNVGLNEATRNSSKVLKPPGGGSSDIFGTSVSEPEPQQRKVKNHLSSSIFGGDDTATPSRNKAGNDSFYNLFGAEPVSRPVSAVKDKFKSNIVLDETTTENIDNDAKKCLAFSEDNAKEETNNERILSETEANLTETNGVYESNGTHVDEETPQTLKSDTPPETSSATNSESNQVSNGEKAEPTVNGTSSSTASTVSTPAAPAPAPAPAPASAPTRQRVPPGGFSSGLW